MFDKRIYKVKNLKVWKTKGNFQGWKFSNAEKLPGLGILNAQNVSKNDNESKSI